MDLIVIKVSPKAPDITFMYSRETWITCATGKITFKFVKAIWRVVRALNAIVLGHKNLWAFPNMIELAMSYDNILLKVWNLTK